MPATLTGKLVNIMGADAAEQGSIEIALCGYGSQVPIVPGSGIIGRLTTVDVAADASGDVTAELWGNDKIAPAGTYYTVTIKNSNGDIMQVNAYVFEDGQSYDLGNVVPFDPNQPPPQLPPLITDLLLILAPADNMVFDGSASTAFKTTLPGNVGHPVFENMASGNLYTFIIVQDGTGNHTFTWAANVFNASSVDPAPNSTTVQTFVADEFGDLYAISAAAYYP